LTTVPGRATDALKRAGVATTVPGGDGRTTVPGGEVLRVAAADEVNGKKRIRHQNVNSSNNRVTYVLQPSLVAKDCCWRSAVRRQVEEIVVAED
jgi:hypothetical protein